MKKLILLLCSLSFILLTACSQTENKNVIRVGTMAGSETTLMQFAKKVAKQRYNLDVEITTFSNYSLPNRALVDGNIDVNMFQHRPFLNAEMKAHGYKLAIVGKVFIYRMGIYSTKIKNLDQLRNGAKVSIPNDPSNEARALLLLQKSGLIRLHPGIDITATPKDIIKNPKHLQFKELDAADLPRTLEDVSIAIINDTFAIPAGLRLKDALYTEGSDSPYANLLVARAGEENEPKFKKLLEALHSPEVVAEAKKLFKGSAIPAWHITPPPPPPPSKVKP